MRISDVNRTLHRHFGHFRFFRSLLRLCPYLLNRDFFGLRCGNKPCERAFNCFGGSGQKNGVELPCRIGCCALRNEAADQLAFRNIVLLRLPFNFLMRRGPFVPNADKIRCALEPFEVKEVSVWFEVNRGTVAMRSNILLQLRWMPQS